MATVRIYKVAELLNTSSQEVMALLKRDHGIEVKSASSTIEEVVAREFVSRMARQRGLNVPSNASFADTPARGQGTEARRQGAGAGQAHGSRAAAATAREDARSRSSIPRPRSQPTLNSKRRSGKKLSPSQSHSPRSSRSPSRKRSSKARPRWNCHRLPRHRSQPLRLRPAPARSARRNRQATSRVRVRQSARRSRR